MQVNNPKREVIIAASEPTGAVVHDGLIWYSSTLHLWYIRTNGAWQVITSLEALAGTVDINVVIDAGNYT